tara:strand:+ start:1258 stop:1482 length:225 start_codon:yes stop_codon:yes gene_type:complete
MKQSSRTSFEKIREQRIKLRKSIEVAKKLQRDSVIIEDDFRAEEIIKIQMDVYNLFIAANITKNVTPGQLNFCL